MSRTELHARIPHRRLSLGVFRTILAIALLSHALGCASHKQATFASPDLAVQDLASALDPLNKPRLREIFGPESDDLVSSGDDVADQNAAMRFLDAYNQKHELLTEADSIRTLQVGDNDWPFPVPIVKRNGGWSFDTAAGLDEILNRRIGANELYTIQVCLCVVDAQREYALLDPDGDDLHEYAQKFLSDPVRGARNGLYWETTSEEPPSPLGPLVADAAAEGYRRSEQGQRQPYHGYYYRMLMSQGPDAAGGAFEYVVEDNMIGGFGVAAWPAVYGNSGIMTFIVNQDGVVFQKDLGAGTDREAAVMSTFNPDASWSAVP
jgi:hypothetical protein